MLSDSTILKHIAKQPKRAAGFKQLVRELGLRGDERREPCQEVPGGDEGTRVASELHPSGAEQVRQGGAPRGDRLGRGPVLEKCHLRRLGRADQQGRRSVSAEHDRVADLTAVHARGPRLFRHSGDDLAEAEPFRAISCTACDGQARESRSEGLEPLLAQELRHRHRARAPQAVGAQRPCACGPPRRQAGPAVP